MSTWVSASGLEVIKSFSVSNSVSSILIAKSQNQPIILHELESNTGDRFNMLPRVPNKKSPTINNNVWSWSVWDYKNSENNRCNTQTYCIMPHRHIASFEWRLPYTKIRKYGYSQAYLAWTSAKCCTGIGRHSHWLTSGLHCIQLYHLEMVKHQSFHSVDKIFL